MPVLLTGGMGKADSIEGILSAAMRINERILQSWSSQVIEKRYEAVWWPLRSLQMVAGLTLFGNSMP
jgi:hypothetical protein